MDKHNDSNLDTTLGPEDEKESLRRFGSSLASAREKKHFHLDYISKETNISIKHLASIEAGQFETLPGEVYVVGFLRSYANILDLDPNLTIKNYRDCKIIKDQKPFVKIDRLTDSNFSRNVFILISVLFFFTAYGIWINFFYDSTKEIFLDNMIDNSAEMVVTNYSNEDFSPISDQDIDDQDNGDATIVDLAEGNYESSERSEALIQKNGVGKILFSESIDRNFEPNVASIEGGKSGSYFSLKAIEDVWVELTSDKEVIFSSLMEGGKSYEFAILPDLKLTASDAALVEVYIDGVSKGDFGEKGAIIQKKIFE